MNEKTAVINVAKHFSYFPAGRYREDGPSTGQRFREDMLIPALEQNEEVLVELDGVVGYGSSFLEGAFGDVRLSKFSTTELHKKLKLHTKLKSIELEIWDYINKRIKNDQHIDATLRSIFKSRGE